MEKVQMSRRDLLKTTAAIIGSLVLTPILSKDMLAAPLAEWPTTPEAFYNLVAVPDNQIPTEVKLDPFFRRLTVDSVAQELDKDGNPTGGWVLIQPERNPVENDRFPFWFIRNQTGGMQYGFMDNVANRNALGFTQEECIRLGFDNPEKHIGSGIPADFVGTVDGITFYPVNSDHPLFSVLGPNAQTVDQRRAMNIKNGL